MDDVSPPYRRATRADASALSELIDMAGDGVPSVFWARVARPGETAADVGRRRARREKGSFSYRNALVADPGDGAVAALVGYPLPDRPEPIPPDLPAKFIPFQELENLACGTWYVNALATYPAHRGRGYGTGLLRLAEGRARALHLLAVSLAVVDANADARRLYERLGFRAVAARPLPRGVWPGPGESVVLMTRAVP